MRITVTGKDGHAGLPWRAIDAVTTSAQIIVGLQTVVSRRTDLMRSPTVVSVTTVNGGSRWNILPKTVDMGGTIRTYDDDIRAGVQRDVRQIAENIARSAGASADVEIVRMYDSVVNDERVTARMVPVLERAANGDAVRVERTGAAEDFSFFLNEVPGLFFVLGIVPRDRDPALAAPNHSADFFVDEAALATGARALAMVAVNYLMNPSGN
jgi:amidohydrolase